MDKPNLLILMVDQMAGTLLDDEMIDYLHMPNLRKLIARGVKFDNAYTSSPLCTPARASFMTGQLPSKNGVFDNAAEFKATTPGFAHYLRNLGYQTALSGKMHFAGPDQLHGFEERLTTDIYPADFGWTPDWQKPLERIDWWYHNLSSVTEAGIAEISNQLEFDDEVTYHAKLKLYQYARRTDTRPFCLCVSFTHPHDPYVARQHFWDRYEHDKIPMPRVKSMPYAQQDPHSQRLYDAVDYSNYELTEDAVRNSRHAYFANLSYLDDKMGEILEVLDKCGFKDNTHILFCSDHGDMLGERGLWYKMSFFEFSCRVPLILAMAGDNAVGTNVTTPVAIHDILPTLLELVGGENIELACEIDGLSVLGLASGNEDIERSARSEYCAEGSLAPMIMIRRDAYKFIYTPTDPLLLFNLEIDPLELNNLAKDPGCATIVEGFKSEMRKHWNFDTFTEDVVSSQKCRRLVDSAHRKGRFTSWDFQPQQNSKERYMRNHLDLNIVESSNRYPKP
jgi:choline-sulfatase